jgi:XTP/dITP diphosphohydrolase
MRIIFCTTNEHKLREIRHILKGAGRACRQAGVKGQGAKVKEDGKTFEENAIKKVKSIKLLPGEIAIADDSGLMVDGLGGKPGVKSARFAFPPTAENLCRKLLRVMNNCSARGAKFVCVIAVKYSSGEIKTVKGVCRGKIIREMRGSHGFGYDPVFVPDGYKKTFAEMRPAFKNRISHRARALHKLKSVI